MTPRPRFARTATATFFVTAFAATTVVLYGVSAAGTGAGPSEPAGACADARPAPGIRFRAVAPDGRRIVSERGASVYVADGAPETVLRNVAPHPDDDATVAVIRDRSATDSLLVGSGSSMRSVLDASDLAEPSWSPSGEQIAVVEDQRAVTIVDASGGRRQTIPAPAGARAVRAPTFRTESVLVASVSEPVAGDERTPGGDTLNNLWEYDLGAQRWERLSDFEADGEHWSVIRTIGRAGTGDPAALFVRVSGTTYGHRDELRWALWRSSADGAVEEVRALPEETYLGALTERHVLFDTQDPETATWTIAALDRAELDDPEATFVAVGCGTIGADPAVPDPDLGAEGAGEPMPDGVVAPDVVEVLVVSGFSSADAALAAARGLADDRSWFVADATDLPLVVAPGDVALVSEADPTIARSTQLGQVARRVSVSAERLFVSAARRGDLDRLAASDAP